MSWGFTPLLSASAELLGTPVNPSGDLLVAETGDDTFTSSGDVIAQGSLSVSEVGSDAFTSTGDVVIQCNLVVSEVGDDIFAASGTVDPFPAMLVDDVEKFDFVGGPNPTISGISFGTPASDRIVVVFFQCAATPSAVTIGGVSATFVANLSGSDYYGIAWAAVPSSSSGSLVLTGGGGYGLFSGAFAVYGEGLPALDFAFVSSATSSDIDLAGGGVVVGAAITTGAISWTGVTEQAEYVGLTGSNTSLALNYDTTYGAPATIQTSPAAITRLLSFGPALAEIVGTLSATESGDDTAAASGEVLVQGDTAATEAGDDTFAAAGTVAFAAIVGTLSITELGDNFISIGKVLVKGTSTPVETTGDSVSANGDVVVQGNLTVNEIASDVITLIGKTFIQGALEVTENTSDTFGSAGNVIIKGVLSGIETNPDIFSSIGEIHIVGNLANTESNDTLSVIGSVVVIGVLSTADAPDVFSAAGGSPRNGELSGIENSTDVFISSAKLPVSGTGNISEDIDTLVSTGIILISGSVSPVETGMDILQTTGIVLLQGDLLPSEIQDSTAMSGKVLLQGALSTTEVDLDYLKKYVSDSYSTGYVGVEWNGKVLIIGQMASVEQQDAFSSTVLIPVAYSVNLRGIRYLSSGETLVLPKESSNISLFP